MSPAAMMCRASRFPEGSPCQRAGRAPRQNCLLSFLMHKPTGVLPNALYDLVFVHPPVLNLVVAERV